MRKLRRDRPAKGESQNSKITSSAGTKYNLNLRISMFVKDLPM